MKRQRHHRRKRARRNPDSAVAAALTWLGGGAIVGAGIGAVSNATNRPAGAMNGAFGGVSLVGVGGIITAIVSPKNRAAGFATAGIGLGGLVLLGLTMSLVAPASLAGNTGVARPLLGPLAPPV